jgi:type II secretory pathway component GspD/PulD (secretin)
MKAPMLAAAALLAAFAAPVAAQDQKPAPGPIVKVQLTLSRYQGEKKIASLPYLMTVNTEDRSRSGRANLRLGTQVPITTMSRPGGDANAPSVPTVVYKDVGTNIDCLVYAYEDGRFRLDLTVEDSSVEGAAEGKPLPANPLFRSFKTSNQLLLRDGQSMQYTTATDKVSGEVWKVDVTLNVVR